MALQLLDYQFNAGGKVNQTGNSYFEFQKWPVYRDAIAIAKEAQKFTLTLPKTGNQSLSDQFKRASQSIALNIAEGSSRTTIKDKVNFMRISKGSVFECASIVDLAFEFELMKIGRASCRERVSSPV